MKTISLVLAAAACFGLPGALRADEVALMKVRFEKGSDLRPVAIELDEAGAPATVANFKKLIHHKFYDGLAFHRAFPHTLVQVGDPFSRHKDRTSVGTGGPGYTLQPEIHRRATLGAVAMARLPDKINPSRLSNGSQFFVCLRPMPEYDGKYTVFGRVFSGLDVLDTLSTMSVDSNDYPVDRIIIKTMRLVPRESLPGPAAPGAAPNSATPAAKPHRPWWRFF